MPRHIRIRMMLIAALLAPMLLLPTLNVVLAQKGPIIIQRPGQPQVVIQPQGNGGAMVLEGGKPVAMIPPNGGSPTILNPPRVNPGSPMNGQTVLVWYCTKCGREISRVNPPVGVTSCPFCHASFRAGVSEPTQKKIEQPAAPANAETKQKEEQPGDTGSSVSSAWIIAPIAAIVIGALAMATGVLLFIGRGQSSQKEKKSGRRKRRSSDDADDDGTTFGSRVE